MAQRTFIDAQEMAQEHPETFSAPSADEILGLRAGQYVKISNGYDRFWVLLTSAALDVESPFDSALRGTVDNELVQNVGYGLGDTVEFEGRHVYALDD